ncbi:MAG: peptidylprolyl isomerase [Phycisphaerae bacterium]|nr:peptidylprolyl isomerase [Phycisphaerae bacterium]
MRWQRILNLFHRTPGKSRAASRPLTPVFEPLEPRLLLAGDLPSISLIEADNRGLIVLTANANLNASTVNTNSVEVTTAGPDQIFGTSDDTTVARTVEYVASSRQIRVSANIAADVRYRVRLNASIIKDQDGRSLDGEFTAANTVSGDGVQGGDLIFYTRRPSETIVRFTTTSGIIDVTMFMDRTPLTVQNFLNYANRGVWDLTFIHRSVPGFVIQGGGFSAQGTNNYPRITQDPPVMNEPGISNIRGTIAMAKLGGNPNSATNEFFFNLGNNASNLDNQNGGFTVFGEIRGSAGLAVMDALAAFQIVNASTVNGAFNELPVIDRTAVLSRPGSFTILTTDLIRYMRIALMVDISGQPAQQLDPTGSVTFGADDGSSGPRVQVFDLDQAGLGDLSQAVQVKFGKNGAITSITLRDGLPSTRIGIAITNATSVGTITDARRNQGGNIAFVISSAPVSSIRFNAAITGYDLNGFVVPGLSLDDDIDDDGLFNDPVAIYLQSGLLKTFRIDGTLTGDVVAPGGFGIVTINGTAMNADFSSASLTSTTVPAFTFRSVVDSEIRVGVGIRSIRAAEWLDTGGRAERISAPSLDNLRIDGDFEAGLNLNRNLSPQRTLGTVRINGSVFGSAWTIQGQIGSITVRGDLTNWSIASATNAGAIALGRVNNSAVTFTGRIARLTAVEWQGGSLVAAFAPSINITGDRRAGVDGDFIGTFAFNGGGSTPVIDALNVNGALRDATITVTGSAGKFAFRNGIDRSTIRVNSGDLRSIDAGEVLNSTINVQRAITSVSATRFEGVSLQGGAYDTITARGDARTGTPGDFHGEIRPTSFFKLDVKGDFTGSINVRNATFITIAGDLSSSTVNFTLAPTLQARGFETFRIGGRIINTDIRAGGRVGHIFAAAMIESGIYIGAPASLVGLPSSNTGFRNGARIEEVTLRGLPGGQHSFVNSFIVALDLNTVRIKNAPADNFGRVYGVAAGTINLVEARIDGTTLRLTGSSTTPMPIGDFNVFLAFTPPPGVVV